MSIARPPVAHLAGEARTVLELWAYLLTMPWLRRLPRGDGHPVVVLPGFMASDISTVPLRAFLRERGYEAYGWGAGRNLGRPGQEDTAIAHVEKVSRTHGRKASLIGWSLGGVYAREIARALPRVVRQVITMGSPFTGDPTANHAWRWFERLSGRTRDEVLKMLHRLRRKPPVPFTAIYSRSDGVTPWRCCVGRPGPRAENVEVASSHLGYGHNPLVLCVIADRLSQPEDEWKPFTRDGVREYLFPPSSDPVRKRRA